MPELNNSAPDAVAGMKDGPSQSRAVSPPRRLPSLRQERRCHGGQPLHPEPRHPAAGAGNRLRAVRTGQPQRAAHLRRREAAGVRRQPAAGVAPAQAGAQAQRRTAAGSTAGLLLGHRQLFSAARGAGTLPPPLSPARDQARDRRPGAGGRQDPGRRGRSRHRRQTGCTLRQAGVCQPAAGAAGVYRAAQCPPTEPMVPARRAGLGAAAADPLRAGTGSQTL
ncbi:hypothetical protein D3C86_1473100 [compost metagenome]